jgi:hypothetical protein
MAVDTNIVGSDKITGQIKKTNVEYDSVTGGVRVPAFQLTAGAALGKILTSDNVGNGTWQANAASVTKFAPSMLLMGG